MWALSRTLGSALRDGARGLAASAARRDSNRASVAHVRRPVYGRLYPVLLVKLDGSTVRVRYREPKRILMLPLDSNTLPEAERRARLRRQSPAKPKGPADDGFEEVDLRRYQQFWKKGGRDA